MQIIFLTLTWIALVMLRALRFHPSGLSRFELNRRLASHDDSVQAILERDERLPLLGALQQLTGAIVAVLLVALLAVGYGVLVGAIVSLPLLYLAELVSARRLVRKRTIGLLGRFESDFIRCAAALSPLLRPLLALRDVNGGTVFYSKDELGELISADHSILSPNEKILLLQGLKFENIKISDVMTPRSVVNSVEVNETLGPVVLDRLHKTGHSRFPVVDGDLEHVVGMLFLHDLVPLDPKLKRARDAMSRKVFYVHQDRNLDHALHAFLRTKHHLFIVVNDFSEVVGLITIEDCLEQIVGRKIVDEFDAYDDLRAVAVKAASKKPETGEVV